MVNKIVCFHLLNNYTGSPKVLKQVVEGLIEKGYSVELVTNKTKGFLSNIEGVRYRYISYFWSKNKLATFLFFFLAELQFFIFVLKSNRKNSIFYINTLVPFGAAWACKLTRRKVVYHVHEKFVKENILHRFMRWSYVKCADKSIFVSNYLSVCYPQINESVVIYNSLDQKYLDVAASFLNCRKIVPGKILLVASIRRYKGIYEFLKLCKSLPEYSFELVMSCTQKELEQFLTNNMVTNNLKIYANQQDLHPFYQRAKLVLNLSIPHLWTETFGMTILEAMAYGIPTIVPLVGGPVELVKDCYNGYLVDSTDTKKLKERVRLLMDDDNLYNTLSKHALDKAKEFSCETMIKGIDNYIHNIDK